MDVVRPEFLKGEMMPASNKGTIRVGIIRCDTHGYWYGSFFQKPDPALFRKVHRGCHYYHYRWDDPMQRRLPSVPGMVVSRTWDENRALAEGLSEAFRGKPIVCDSFDQVSEDVDLVYIAASGYEGKMHLTYATPGLKRGVPHFVDKPFAFTLKDARAMIALAKRHKTAVMTSSLLRRSPFLAHFRIQMKDIAPVGSLLVPCGGPSLAGVYHGLSVVQALLGEGCESVESMGPTLYDVLRLHYANRAGGTYAIVFNARGTVPGRKGIAVRGYAHDYDHCVYWASAYGADGSALSPRVDDYRFVDGGVTIVKMAKRMAQTNKPPIPYEHILELTEIIEAARLAHNKGKRVYLKDVR